MPANFCDVTTRSHGRGAACESRCSAIHPDNRQRRFEGLRPNLPRCKRYSCVRRGTACRARFTCTRRTQMLLSRCLYLRHSRAPFDPPANTRPNFPFCFLYFRLCLSNPRRDSRSPGSLSLSCRARIFLLPQSSQSIACTIRCKNSARRLALLPAFARMFPAPAALDGRVAQLGERPAPRGQVRSSGRDSELGFQQQPMGV